jgi:c-di-GMP-binding flagellar brake protein YcgR
MKPQSLSLDIEEFFEVGLAAIIVTRLNRPDMTKSMTAIRGWRPGRFILVDRPRTSEGHEAIIAVGSPCKVRLISAGQACEFKSQLLDIDTSTRNGELRLRWPSMVRQTAFRKYERVNLESACTCTTTTDETIQATLRDISVGGFSIQTKQDLSEYDEFTVSFTLPDGAQINDARAEVRSRGTTKDGYLTGCQFSKDQGYLENEVAYFVSTFLHQFRSGGQVEIPPRLLIVDKPDGPTTEAREVFHDAGIETLLATNSVDAVYRMRISHPLALWISDGIEAGEKDALMGLLASGPVGYQVPVYVTSGGEVGKFTPQDGKPARSDFSVQADQPDEFAKAIVKDIQDSLTAEEAAS